MYEKDEAHRACGAGNVAAIVGFAGVLVGVAIAIDLGATGRADTGAAALLDARGRAPVIACTPDADEDGREWACASPRDTSPRDTSPFIPASLSDAR
jgi:hypothetical protein